MVTLVEKRSSDKFCDFHNDKGHNTDKCMQLKNHIEELVQAGKLLHLIKEIKQGRDQAKVGKKEASAKDKSLEIYMVQPWHRTTKQKVTQSFACVSEITFPPLTTSKGTEGPLVIEAEICGHMIHRMYVDGGSSMEVLYEHYFNRLRPEIKSQMVPATTLLTGFSGETIWPLGQLNLAVFNRSESMPTTKQWMNFMIVMSLSPYNGIIRRPRIREIQAIPSTAYGMLKFTVDGGIVTIRSTILIPDKCATVTTSSKEILKEAEMKGVRPQNVPKQSKRSLEGIKPCPDKTEVVLQLSSPRTIKEVQSLNGKLASLDRFLSKSKTSLQQLKQHLSELPLLVTPKPKEELIVYLFISHEAISAVLMTERGTVQTPIYFISCALQGPELNYTPMEKLVLALVFAAKRLRRYFQAHPIAFITDQPIKQIISRPDVARRLQKWSVMLGEHNITYRPGTSMKGKILADFLVEKPDEAPLDTSVVKIPQES
ncbi:reverse transcriptase domain-containing protein [Tanacetum coccineum]